MGRLDRVFISRVGLRERLQRRIYFDHGLLRWPRPPWEETLETELREPCCCTAIRLYYLSLLIIEVNQWVAATLLTFYGLTTASGSAGSLVPVS